MDHCLRTETHCGFCDASILYSGRSFPTASELELEENRKRNALLRAQNRARIIRLRRNTSIRETYIHPDGLLCMTYHRTGKLCHHHRHQIISYIPRSD